MIITCHATIELSRFVRIVTRGRGLERREVCVYLCPLCGAQRDLRKNWRGPIPNGAFVCGAAQIKEDKPA